MQNLKRLVVIQNFFLKSIWQLKDNEDLMILGEINFLPNPKNLDFHIIHKIRITNLKSIAKFVFKY